MKFALHSRVSNDLLKKADEIIVNWSDRNSILDIGHDYNVPIILKTPADADLEELMKLKELAPNGLILEIDNITLAENLSDLKINFYFNYHIKTHSELNSIIAYGPSYIKLDAPLFFRQTAIRNLVKDIPIRIDPVKMHGSYFNFSGDVETGIWVRPEDAHLYENCIFEFDDTERRREEALYSIYSKEQYTGKLSDLLNVEDTGAYNNLIATPTFGEARLNCGQACLTGGRCRICFRALAIAKSKEEIEAFKEKMLNI